VTYRNLTKNQQVTRNLFSRKQNNLTIALLKFIVVIIVQYLLLTIILLNRFVYVSVIISEMAMPGYDIASKVKTSLSDEKGKDIVLNKSSVSVIDREGTGDRQDESGTSTPAVQPIQTLGAVAELSSVVDSTDSSVIGDGSVDRSHALRTDTESVKVSFVDSWMKSATYTVLNAMFRAFFVMINNFSVMPTYVIWCFLLLPLRHVSPDLYQYIEQVAFQLIQPFVAFWMWTASYLRMYCILK